MGEKTNMFSLPAILDITASVPFREEMLKALSSGGSAKLSKLKLNASEVEKITTPCLQILLAADKMLEEKGGALVLHAPSEAMARAMEDMGLQDILQKWSKV